MKYTILLCLSINIGFNIQAQKEFKFSIENSLEYNFRIPNKFQFGKSKPFSTIHESILFVSYYKNNLFFIGPQFSSFTGYLYDPIDKINPYSLGINLGYKHLFCNSKKNPSFKMFSSLSFSIYELKYFEKSPGSNYKTPKKISIVENDIYLGLYKSFGNNFYIYSGLGFGSTQGFILMFESFMLSTNFGFGLNL
jgi:hypothetical protein